MSHNTVESVSHLPAFGRRHRQISRDHRCTQSSVNVHSHTRGSLLGTHCLKICAAWQTQWSSETAEDALFLPQLLTCSDFQFTIFMILLATGMQLCSICNRCTKFVDVDDDDDEWNVQLYIMYVNIDWLVKCTFCAEQ